MLRSFIIALVLAVCASSAAVAANSIAEVKRAADGTHVRVTGKVVSVRLWGDRFYIVEPDRSCGIGVLSTAAVSAGQLVTVDGYKATVHGEGYIGVAAVSTGSSAAAPKPLGMSSMSFLSEPSSTGLPVKVWGIVTSGMQADSTLGNYFTLSDGGPDEVRVYVGTTGAQAPLIGLSATVTGTSGMNGATPVVLVANSGDIQAYLGAVDPATTPEWVWSACGIARVSLSLSAVTAACADGADVIEVPVQNEWYCFYPSTVATPGGGYGDGALLAQIISYAHSHGAKVIGAMPACKDASCLTAHTDWRQRPTDSDSWLTQPADQVSGCLISPYGDYLINEVVELARNIGLDGVSLQGYSNTQPICYCSYCKAAYLAETGASIPSAVNYDSAGFRRYMQWRDARITDHLNKLRFYIRLRSPEFGVFAWSENAGVYSHYSVSPHTMPTSLNSLFDCAMQYVRYDDASMGLSVIPEFGIRYMSALAGHGPWVSEADYTTRSDDPTIGVVGSSLPEAEVEFRALSAIASGARTSFSSTQKQYMRSSIFSMARARNPWTVHAEPMKWAAMVVSESTRQLYGRSNAVDLYMRNCFGFMRMMLEQHLPVEIISDADLESGALSGYKVLILPGTACLSGAAVSAIRNYVAAGGGLVATGAASLYDGEGAARADYALSDLFKATKTGLPIYMALKVYVTGAYSRNQAVLDTLLSPYGHLTSYGGDVFQAGVISGGTTMATICTDGSCSSTLPMYINYSNPGGGRVAYFPSCMDAAYYRYSYPYEGVLLKDAVTWAASAPPSVTVVGPKSLQVTHFTQQSGKRLVVHLLNATNTRGAHTNPAGDAVARDEVAPLYDIQVWFESASPTSVTLEPEGAVLTLYHEGARTRVIVPELQQHSMVVADMP